MTYGINVNILDIQIAITNQQKTDPVNLKREQIIWIDNIQINKESNYYCKTLNFVDNQMKGNTSL